MSDQSIAELYGQRALPGSHSNWKAVVGDAVCPYLGRQCVKIRKSSPDITIGTCSVAYGGQSTPVMICPHRLLEGRQIFADCVHLLSSHEPGNKLFIIQEFGVPGGSIDYVLVSVRRGKVVDFVGIELQTLDSTGTVWPARERFLKSIGLKHDAAAATSSKRYGMNWKMTAKTILVQLHHKVRTFENVNRRLVLVLQDRLLKYMEKEFQFGHLSSPPSNGDSMHLHAYDLSNTKGSYRMEMARRVSTDDAGVAVALGLQAEANVKLTDILASLEAKLPTAIEFSPV